jgi:hypothetical protein
MEWEGVSCIYFVVDSDQRRTLTKAMMSIPDP